MKKSIVDYKVKGQRVILRLDLNVPMNSNGVITSDTKIQKSLPTIKYLLENGAKIIIVSHLGRPKGKVQESLSLKPVVERMKYYLEDVNIFLSDGILCDDTRKKRRNLMEGEILFLENIRFVPEEELNDKDFAQKLAGLGDIYCNDSFGTVHRKHASVAAITEFLPSCAGLLMIRELKVFEELMRKPERPFVAILGGSKVSDKIGSISKLIEKVDTLIIGGAMAYTFLSSMGFDVGRSLVEDDKLELARLLLQKAKNLNVEVLLPVDHVVANEFSFLAEFDICDSNNIKPEGIGMDIGPKSAKFFARAISKASTVYWNGPMGVFEFSRFARGTEAIARAMSKNRRKMIVGGGDSSSAVEGMGLAEKFYHVSTGGGSSLAYIEGSDLPGLIHLQEKE